MTLALEVKDLSFSYDGEKPIIDNISFSLQKGETLGIIGLSGCGKSTLCQCLCGIIPHIQHGIMHGDVLLQGQNTRRLSLPRLATKVGMVFQDPESQLFLPIVESELAFGPENLCIAPDKIKHIISQVASLVKIEPLLYKSPNEISGGQRQLVALSSVLCLNPEILILDEVTSQLDSESSERILDIIIQLKKMGKTIIITDHNLKRLKVADRILAMRDGEILALGSASELLANRDTIEKCFKLDE